MAFFWIAETAPGSIVASSELAQAGLDVTFATQAEAEAWLTGTYPDLLDLGVEQVSLFEEDRLIYGPMPLSA